MQFCESKISKWTSTLIIFIFCFSQGFSQLPTEFQKVELLTGLANATTMKFAPDGRIFIVDRYGELLIYKPETQTTVSAGVLPVFHGFEDGFLGLAFDPDFTSNQKVYIYYSIMPLSADTNRISQFTMSGDTLDLSSEIPMLEWTVQRINSYHAGGDMTFDSQGNLYIAVGDNANHGLYGAIDENNANNSAEKSSSHTNDYRGKILRIKPDANTGTYSIPPGNLFPQGTPFTRPEIYVMGARNPYRMFVDKNNDDWLFWCDVGPDANTASSSGPEGLDEINLTKTAGNYGWPHFAGEDNDPYQMTYKSPSPFYNNPSAPENTSVWNKAPNTIGAKILPPAKPAWLELFHKSYFAGPKYYYDAASTDQQRLPVEFDDVFFYYDFNTSRIWAIKMDTSGNILSNEQMAPSVFPTSKNGFIDMKIGPDGHMYILEYGTGCCPQNAGTGKLVRVDYTGISTNAPPNVVINADVTSGSIPLKVNFNSDGTIDPNGDTSFIYGWDFQSDGIIDATTAETTYTFTSPGTYNVKLSVSDGKGGVGVQNVTIHAGNNPATFHFNSPPDGGFVGWGDDITIDLVVSDEEDGTTQSGIDCADVSIVPSLGHLNHFHDGATVDGCNRTLTLQYEGHDIDGGADIFYVLGTNYTDQGGLQSFDQIKLHPKRKEAEYYDSQSGVVIVPNTDVLLGGESSIRVNNDSHISFEGRNLLNIHSVRYRVASVLQGGGIEMRIGSPNGALLSTTIVPSTGSLTNWTNIESDFIDPGGKNDLYFIFKNASGSQNIFDVNYVEFIGDGVSIDRSPPQINRVEVLNETAIKVEFSEYMDISSAETLNNYSLDSGASVLGAAILSDERTVLLSVSPMSSNESYTLTVQNSQNRAGLPVATGNFALDKINAIRINTGGPQFNYNGENFNADQFVTGGQLYSAAIAIDNTINDELYQTERYGVFTYEIPVDAPGNYDFILHFAELYFGVGRAGGVGSRIFDVTIEGTPALTNFDILAETNPATALKKKFKNISVTDGFATIQFLKVVENPKLSGIEILSTVSSIPEPNVKITSPNNGSYVNQPFEVSFTVDSWTIEEGGTHMHYAVDGEIVGPHYDYGPITIENLDIGSHTIRLELYDIGHTPIGVYDEINITVTEQGACNSTPFPDSWEVHQLEANPYTAVYTIPDYDLDGDGLKDIVTGGWWYKNPGSASGNWVKKSIGGNFGNVVHVYDFDGDGHMDLLGTQIGPAGLEYRSERLLWAKNDGNGNFTVYDNIPVVNSGYFEPFVGGIAGGNFGLGSPYQMAINWNGAEASGFPVQMLTPSPDPTTGMWTLVDISNNSSGEDIEAGDIDGDGYLDLYQGINWLRNEGNGNWTTFSTGITYATTPDRVQLADFNGNGRLDGVVGQLGLGGKDGRYEFAWFESPADPTQPWIKHVLSNDVKGSLSVFAIDIDFDGDMDIVVGEWLGDHRLLVFENDLCNSGEFILRVLDDGDLNLEHHDAAMVTDIDNDGDLDVISNGWRNDMVPRIYENTSVVIGNQEPIANAGEDQSIMLPTNTSILNGTGSDPDGGSVTFFWSQRSGPNNATLDGSNTAQLAISNLIEGNYIFRLVVTDDENQTAFDEVKVTVLPEVIGGFALRINAGGPQTVYNGENFNSDQFVTGGYLYDGAIAIDNTTNDELYQTERYGVFTYEIPVDAPGNYDFVLHFAELYFGVGRAGGPGSRIFDVTIEGTPVLTNFDILAETNPATALKKEFSNISVTDGFATIQFLKVVENPKLSGIEILSSSSIPTPKIKITSPNNGSYVNQPFEVSFEVDNWTIEEGETYLNYAIDGEIVGPYYDYDPITIENLSIGNHTIRLDLYDNEHTPIGVYDEIHITVTEQGACNSTPFPDSWEVHQLEENPYTAVYTIPNYDLNGDGLKDIVTGGWWYKNPGSASGNWVKKSIGGNFGNVVHVYDFDGDGHMDLLGTQKGPNGVEYRSERLLWAKNDGNGNFTVYDNIPVVNSGYWEPFLAGIAGGNFGLGSPYQMAINWNGAESTGFPVQLLTPSPNPTTGMWTLVDISNESSGEDIVAGDIDGDGYLDLFQGINWLRNEGNGSWTTFSTGITYATTPDRVQLADFNGNGRLDGVVGQLGLGSSSAKYEFAWFESPADPTQLWIKHVLSNDVKGSLSVFAIDIDFDGDMDIVVGEWLGDHRLLVFENDLCNSGEFILRVIDDGALNLEHHDGAMITDIDNDGDLDVISNGWRNDLVPRIYENTSVVLGNQDPIANAGEDQSIMLPTNTSILNGTGSDPDGGNVTFLWSQRSGPNSASLDGRHTAQLAISNMIEGDYIFRLVVTDDENQTAFDDVKVSVLAHAVNDFALRINAGGPKTTYNGKTFEADQYFELGQTLDRPQTGLTQPHRSIRYGSSGIMAYNIPVPNGQYSILLHFAEVWFGATGGGAGGVGNRIFNISLENELRESKLDVFAQAGGAQTLLTKSYEVTVMDGILNIDFTSIESGGVRHPIINAIEVLGETIPSIPPIADAGPDQSVTLPINSVTFTGTGIDSDGGEITTYNWSQITGPNAATLNGQNSPILSVSNLMEGNYTFRLTVADDGNDTAYDDVVLTVQAEVNSGYNLRINAGGPQTTYDGKIFETDQYFNGGSVLDRPQTGLSQPHRTIRYGSSGIMTYNIPVPNGQYSIRLHFAEVYFGATGGGSGGVGNRVFDITMEGVLVEDNLDVFLQAGGAQTILIKSYSVTVNDGVLNMDFSSLGNGGVRHPIINAIEIIGGTSNKGENFMKNSEENIVLDNDHIGGASELSKMIKVVPNPAKYDVQILLSNDSIKIAQCNIYDVEGRLVMKLHPIDSQRSTGSYRFNVSNLDNALYVIDIITDNGSNSRHKLIINR